MDRIKASPYLLGVFQPMAKDDYSMHYENAYYGHGITKREARWAFISNTLFWWSLGLDQMVHHLTDLIIVFIAIGVL